MEDKKFWFPVVFDGKPQIEEGSRVEGNRRTDLMEDQGEKPSFCDGTVAINHSNVNCLELQPAETMVPQVYGLKRFGREMPACQTRVLSGTISNQSRREERPRTPKPYDVARELMAVLPLRMVDNALYSFDGRVYRFVSVEVIYRIIMANCRRHVEAVGDASLIERVYKIIQAEPAIVFRPPSGQLRYVALEDGLLDLDTFTLHPHTPSLFVTALLNGSFTRGQASGCPNFDRFLAETAGGDPELVERIWEMIGYVLVPDNSGKCFFLLQGVPDSGKSQLADIIASLLDEDSVTSLDLAALGERFGASGLVGKQLCIVPDMPAGVLDNRSVSVLKALTGGDVVTVDVKYQPRIKFRCRATFVLATNHAIITRDFDPAFIRRAVVVPFRFSVPKERQNCGLKERVLMEKDAIIYNGLLAYRRLREQRYRFAGRYELNEVTTKNEEKPRTSINEVLWDFCQQNLRLDEGGFVSSSDLYSCFQNVTGTSFPGGLSAFSTRIRLVIDQMFPSAVTRSRTRITGNHKQERGFKGITVRSIFD